MGSQLDCGLHGCDEETKRKVGFESYPTMVFFRRQSTDSAGELRTLLGAQARTKTSEELLISASRRAGMSEQNDGKRLNNLGEVGNITEIDATDFTAKLRMPSEAKGIWFPLEAISLANGTNMPRFSRHELPVSYSNALKPEWDYKHMKEFAERMTRKPYYTLLSTDQLGRELETEALPALVLCADDASAAFKSLAKLWQPTHRSYVASTIEACPVDVARPALVIYSPAHQQWNARGPSSAKAAAVVADSSVLRRYSGSKKDELVEWAKLHRFPGIFRITDDNFALFVNSGRNSLVLAVQTDEWSKIISEEEKIEIEEKILEAADPTPGPKLDLEVYSYTEGTPFWGVVDGEEIAVEHFGVYPSQLPQAILFADIHTWFSDSSKLTIGNLKRDLKELGTLTPSTIGINPGSMLVAFYVGARRMFYILDKKAQDFGGQPFRIFMYIFLFGCLIFVLALIAFCVLVCKIYFEGEKDEPSSKTQIELVQERLRELRELKEELNLMPDKEEDLDSQNVKKAPKEAQSSKAGSSNDQPETEVRQRKKK